METLHDEANLGRRRKAVCLWMDGWMVWLAAQTACTHQTNNAAPYIHISRHASYLWQRARHQRFQAPLQVPLLLFLRLTLDLALGTENQAASWRISCLLEYTEDVLF